MWQRKRPWYNRGMTLSCLIPRLLLGSESSYSENCIYSIYSAGTSDHHNADSENEGRFALKWAFTIWFPLRWPGGSPYFHKREQNEFKACCCVMQRESGKKGTIVEGVSKQERQQRRSQSRLYRLWILVYFYQQHSCWNKKHWDIIQEDQMTFDANRDSWALMLTEESLKHVSLIFYGLLQRCNELTEAVYYRHHVSFHLMIHLMICFGCGDYWWPDLWNILQRLLAKK